MARDQNLPSEIQHTALLRLLTNSLVLSQTTPYLSFYDVLNLAATSRAFRYLIYQTPQVFRRLDLGSVKTAQFDVDAIDHGGETWRNVQVDENLTEDDFYSGPLRGIFSNLKRSDILRDVQILTLDGLSVTAELVHDILIDPSFSVRILSIRDVKNLNDRKLRQALQYACRDSRPEGTPRLQGLYVFGPKEPTPGALVKEQSRCPSPASPAAVAAAWNDKSQKALTASLAEEPDAWYGRRGKQFPHRIDQEWASTLAACDGIIAFDAVLCTGPRHLNSPAWGKVNTDAPNAAGSPASVSIPHFSVATHGLGGCAGCGSAPEGWTTWGEDVYSRERDARRSSNIGRFPLLAPPPVHSSTLGAAMCPSGQPLRRRNPFYTNESKKEKACFIPRCLDCIRDRYCTGCNQWWCETCYIGAGANSGPDVSTSSPSSTGVVDGNNDGGSRVKIQDGRCAGGNCLLHRSSVDSMAADSEPPV